MIGLLARLDWGSAGSRSENQSGRRGLLGAGLRTLQLLVQIADLLRDINLKLPEGLLGLGQRL